MNIQNSLKSDFEWWSRTIEHPFCNIKIDIITTWRFSLMPQLRGGGLRVGIRKPVACGVKMNVVDIHFFEILAAFIGLKIFAKDLSNSQILLCIDNTTAIFYVNRMGGIQFPHLTDVTKQLWQWCEYRHLYVFASYIRSSDNFDADQESRRRYTSRYCVATCRLCL